MSSLRLVVFFAIASGCCFAEYRLNGVDPFALFFLQFPVGFLRFIGIGLCWAMLLIVIGAAVGGLVVYSRLNNEVQNHVLAELQKRYPDLKIQVGSAQIVENRGMTVKDIEFSVPHLFGQSTKLLRIGELFIECPVTLQSLYQKNPQISRIVIKDAILGASRAADGTFPELQLLAGGKDSPLPFSVEIENGTLLYADVRQSAPPLRLAAINLTLTPEMQDQTQQILIKGTADGDFFRRLDIEAQFQPETKQWQFSAKCRQFDWSDDLWQYLPPNPYLKERPLFQGRFDFDVKAVSDSAADWGCRFALGGTLAHGRLDFPKINRTLSELSTRFEITNERVLIDKLRGNGDSARFEASFSQEGLTFFGDSRQQAELVLNVQDLRFDEELIKILSPVLNEETKRLLAQFDYEGTTGLHAQLSCRNGKWIPSSVSMQISEVGFAHHALPYRLDRLSGNLIIDETAALHFHFTAKQEAPFKAEIDGHYYNIFEDAAGKVEITGENVPIDAKLMKALTPTTQQVVNSLHPSGTFAARLLFELPPGDVPMQKHFDIALNNVSVQYEHFPYPLRDVKGFLNYDGTVWQFRDISGTNGTASVKGAGHLRPVGSVYQSAQEFVLYVSADELPIDDQLTQALLKPDQRRLLQSLNVNGKVNLTAQIKYRTDDKQLHLQFQAVPRAGLSICADRFPYKIDDVEGEIRYENGRVFAERLKGTHRDTKWRSGLDCRFTADGQSVLRLTPLEIDWLQADRELLDALPSSLQDSLKSIQLTKPFNLSGGIEHRQSAQGEQSVHWDLKCILFQNSAKLGLPFENICGIIRSTGHSAADQIQLNGELALDSLTAYGFPATSVRGPFSFNGKYLQLGIPINRQRPDIVPRPLTGKVCDGMMSLDGLVVWDNGVSYALRTDLLGADLAKIAQIVEPKTQKTSGTLNCVNVNLRGNGTKWETIGGTGTIQLRDANLYDAPVMVRLLRELRFKETDPKAGMFSSMDVNFRLSGLRMYFNDVTFEGGAILLQGEGMMQLDSRQVDLTMKTRLGNRRMQIPLLSDFVGGVSDQLVQLRITGSLSDPTVTRAVIPEIQRALQSIPPEDALPPSSDAHNRFVPSKIFRWNAL